MEEALHWEGLENLFSKIMKRAKRKGMTRREVNLAEPMKEHTFGRTVRLIQETEVEAIDQPAADSIAIMEEEETSTGVSKPGLTTTTEVGSLLARALATGSTEEEDPFKIPIS